MLEANDSHWSQHYFPFAYFHSLKMKLQTKCLSPKEPMRAQWTQVQDLCCGGHQGRFPQPRASLTQPTQTRGYSKTTLKTHSSMLATYSPYIRCRANKPSHPHHRSLSAVTWNEELVVQVEVNGKVSQEESLPHFT